MGVKKENSVLKPYTMKYYKIIAFIWVMFFAMRYFVTDHLLPDNLDLMLFISFYCNPLNIKKELE